MVENPPCRKPLGEMNNLASGRRDGKLDLKKALGGDTGGERLQLPGLPGAAGVLREKRGELSAGSEACVSRISKDAPEPYDPVTNPLSLRPIYLRYDPKRRRRILRRARALQGETDDDVSLNCWLDTSSHDSSSSSPVTPPSSPRQPRPYRFFDGTDGTRESGDKERDQEVEDEENIEGNEDAEEERPSYAKAIFKAFVLVGVVLLSSNHILSMRYPSTVPPAQAHFEGHSTPNLSSFSKFGDSSKMRRQRGPEVLTRFPVASPPDLLDMSFTFGEEETGRNLKLQFPVIEVEEESRIPSEMARDDYGIGLFPRLNLDEGIGEDVAGVSYDLEGERKADVAHEKGEYEMRSGAEIEIERGWSKCRNAGAILGEQSSFFLGDNPYQDTRFGNRNAYEEHIGLAQESGSIGRNSPEVIPSKPEQSPFPLMKYLAVIFTVMSILLSGIRWLIAPCKQRQDPPGMSKLVSSKCECSPGSESKELTKTSKERLVTPRPQKTSSVEERTGGANSFSSQDEDKRPNERFATPSLHPSLSPEAQSVGYEEATFGIRSPLVELLGEQDFSRRKAETVAERVAPSEMNSTAATGSDGGIDIATSSRWKSPAITNRLSSSRETPQSASLSTAKADYENVKRKEEVEGTRKRSKVSSTSPPTPATVRRSARIHSRSSQASTL